MARKKTRKKNFGFGTDSQALDKHFNEFEQYLAKKQWSKAEEVLEELEQRFPTKKEVLEYGLILAYVKEDWTTYQQKATEYALKYPDEPDAYLRLSHVCMQNTYPLLALEALQKFCDKFPNHPEVSEAKPTIDKLLTLVPELLEAHELEGEQGLEIGRLMEQGRFLFESNRYAEASQILERLIDLVPNLSPPWNNLSLIRCLEGDITGAIALAQQVLASNPTNFHALGNLVRFHLFLGEREQAQQYLNQLKALDNQELDVWVKKAESLSYFGDWSGLVELGNEAESSPVSQDLTALFWHCVAVAHATLGQTKKARQLWKKSLKLEPGFDYAQRNLDNINQPLDQQHTPWAFEIGEWFSTKLKEEITQMVAEAEKGNSSKAITENLIKRNPHIIPLSPILLRQGSPTAREFVTHIAIFSQRSELVEALKEYAFGQEGSDRDRLEVLQQLSQQQLITPGTVTVWRQGKQEEILLMGMEINDKPTVIHSKKVQRLAQKAVACLKTGEHQEAEAVLQKALELEPTAPDLKLNLANAYFLQDREEEAFGLLHQINQESPQYTFAAISLAKNHLNEGDLEKAEEFIKPLLQKQQFHYQEFGQLCKIQIELAIKRKNQEGAKAWLNMWKDVANENDPELEYWRNRLEGKSSWLLKSVM